MNTNLFAGALLAMSTLPSLATAAVYTTGFIEATAYGTGDSLTLETVEQSSAVSNGVDASVAAALQHTEPGFDEPSTNAIASAAVAFQGDSFSVSLSAYASGIYWVGNPPETPVIETSSISHALVTLDMSLDTHTNFEFALTDDSRSYVRYIKILDDQGSTLFLCNAWQCDGAAMDEGNGLIGLAQGDYVLEAYGETDVAAGTRPRVDYEFSMTVSEVPLPASLPLMLTALLGLSATRKESRVRRWLSRR